MLEADEFSILKLVDYRNHTQMALSVLSRFYYILPFACGHSRGCRLSP